MIRFRARLVWQRMADCSYFSPTATFTILAQGYPPFQYANALTTCVSTEVRLLVSVRLILSGSISVVSELHGHNHDTGHRLSRCHRVVDGKTIISFLSIINVVELVSPKRFAAGSCQPFRTRKQSIGNLKLEINFIEE